MHIIPTSPLKSHQQGSRGSKWDLLRRKLSRLTVMIDWRKTSCSAVWYDHSHSLTFSSSIFSSPLFNFSTFDYVPLGQGGKIGKLKWHQESVNSSLHFWQAETTNITDRNRQAASYCNKMWVRERKINRLAVAKHSIIKLYLLNFYFYFSF